MVDEIISLSAERERRNPPDPEHTMIGRDGIPIFEFGAEFTVDGRDYCFQLWAKDWADAERRLEALKTNARIAGQLYASIPE